MNITITAEDIQTAFDTLNLELEKAQDAQQALDDWKAQIDIEKNRATSRGVEGSNEAVRKANLELMFEQEYEQLAHLQKQRDRALMYVKIAENKCSAIRNIIRLYQIAVPASQP